MPKFSIIIPVYNVEKYIKKCIDSVINQEYQDFEIILVNDGSKDKSGEICNEYEKIDNRVTVIHEKNSGVSTARNIGINNANGTYIIFLDSDDSLKEEALTKLNNIIEENRNIDCILFNMDNRLQNKIYKEDELTQLIIKLIITEKINPPWNKIYKRSIIKEKNILFDNNIQIGEDLLFSITYFSYAKDVYVLNEELYNYTIDNDNSLTRKYKENKYNQLMYVDGELKKYLETFKSKKMLECEKYVRLKNIFSCFIDLSNPNCKFTKRQKRKYIKEVKKNNKIVIKKLGIKLYFVSIVYLILPSSLMLITSKIFFKIKKNAKKGEFKH